VSGGAPLSQEIAEFFFTAGFTILEGYGLSETCILSLNRAKHFKFGTVGHPFRDTEIKIDSDGEICVKGPQVMKGYYKRPDATAEVIDSEGWFHTGDIGEFDSEGFLKITDRKKDLIVTAGGKKVAPQPIENTLKKDPLIESVCLLGDKKKYIVALIVPNLELCKSWGEKKGISLKNLEDCVNNELLRDHFQRELNDINRVFAVIFLIILIGVVADRLLFSPLERAVQERWGFKLAATKSALK
jgi:long-chain acyl-CoA synthetase